MDHPEVEMATGNWLGISLVVLTVGVGVARGQDPNLPGSPMDQIRFCPGAELHPRLSSETMAGHLMQRPDPIFPSEAAEAHVSGSVALMVCIGVDGHVTKAVPISGPQMLRKAYVDAVSRWVYRPYLVDAVAVPVITTVSVSFAIGAPPEDEKLCWNARPVRVSSGTMRGLQISGEYPKFPQAAREAHVSGSTVVRVCIDRDGKVKGIQPIAGPEMLRKAVVDAVSDWVYRPYLIDGKPVPVDTTITVIMHGGGG